MGHGDDYKDRIRAAVLKHHRPAKKRSKKPRGSNKKPEEKSVKEIKVWCKENRIQIHRYESKAKWSASAGMYLSDAVEVGHPDLAGCNPFGLAVFIEVKARGKRHSLRPAQHQFLLRKIESNCFACVSDSAEYVESLYRAWVSAREQSLDSARQILLNALPCMRHASQESSSFF